MASRNQTYIEQHVVQTELRREIVDPAMESGYPNEAGICLVLAASSFLGDEGDPEIDEWRRFIAGSGFPMNIAQGTDALISTLRHTRNQSTARVATIAMLRAFSRLQQSVGMGQSKTFQRHDLESLVDQCVRVVVASLYLSTEEALAVLRSACVEE